MIFSLPVEVGYQTFVASLQKIVKVSLMEAIKANKVTCIKSLARRKKITVTIIIMTMMHVGTGGDIGSFWRIEELKGKGEATFI